MNQPLFAVYGVSGCGRGVMPLAREQLRKAQIGLERLVFVDDKPEASWVNGHRVVTYQEFLQEPATERHAALAVANGEVRQKLALKCARDRVHSWDIKADNVITMDSVELGEGSILCPFVTLTSNIKIGRHFQANLYGYVEHDCVIGDFVTFAPGAKCNGNVVIEDLAYIGSGAVVKQGRPGKPLMIGRGAVVGMGAVVTRDVPPGATVVGNPARLLVKGMRC